MEGEHPFDWDPDRRRRRKAVQGPQPGTSPSPLRLDGSVNKSGIIIAVGGGAVKITEGAEITAPTAYPGLRQLLSAIHDICDEGDSEVDSPVGLFRALRPRGDVLVRAGRPPLPVNPLDGIKSPGAC